MQIQIRDHNLRSASERMNDPVQKLTSRSQLIKRSRAGQNQKGSQLTPIHSNRKQVDNDPPASARFSKSSNYPSISVGSCEQSSSKNCHRLRRISTWDSTLRAKSTHQLQSRISRSQTRFPKSKSGDSQKPDLKLHDQQLKNAFISFSHRLLFELQSQTSTHCSSG